MAIRKKSFLNSIRSRVGISQPRPRRKQRVTGQANQPLGGTRRRVPSPGGTRNPNPRRDNLRGVPSRKPAPNMGGTRGGRRPRPKGKIDIGRDIEKGIGLEEGKRKRRRRRKVQKNPGVASQRIRKPRPGRRSKPVLPPNKPRRPTPKGKMIDIGRDIEKGIGLEEGKRRIRNKRRVQKNRGVASQRIRKQ